MVRYLRGQIWWCKNTYDVNSNERELPTDSQKLFDHLQKGMRPVLIVSNDTGNKFADILQVVPCTSSEKKALPTHCSFYIDRTKNTFLCEQLKTVNKSDLTNYLTTLESKEMAVVENCLKIALGIPVHPQEEKISLEITEPEGSEID